MNTTEKIIEHKDFGEIRIRKSSNAKKLSISVRPFEGIRVTIPTLVSFKRAEKFIEEKEIWLRRTALKIRDLEENHTIFNDHTVFNTKEHTLVFVRIEDEHIKVLLKDRMIRVYIPLKRNIEEREIQEMIRWGIEAAWRKEAKKYLPARIRELARLHGFDFKKVTIKNTRTRWGSCSNRNNINLSLHLMRLPTHLTDYVLMHELVHTVHKNHSRQFWKLMDKLTGNARALDKELKNYRIDIY